MKADQGHLEESRKEFEAMYESMGFDMQRQSLALPEPWSEYVSEATGYAWAGWSAATSLQEERLARMREALSWAIREIERNTCGHETTHRGGAIWTICDDCGAKWADDRGGFESYREPTELTAARKALEE